nr:MAG TPA: hypothetical protein [Caudoviricetes sp.]
MGETNGPYLQDTRRRNGGVRDSWDRKSFPPHSARTTTSPYTWKRIR